MANIYEDLLNVFELEGSSDSEDEQDQPDVVIIPIGHELFERFDPFNTYSDQMFFSFFRFRKDTVRTLAFNRSIVGTLPRVWR